MDEAKKLLCSGLLQAKQAVITWWKNQIIIAVRLPNPPLSHSRTPSGDFDAAGGTSQPQSPRTPPVNTPDYLLPSRDRDEHDLTEASLFYPKIVLCFAT